MPRKSSGSGIYCFTNLVNDKKYIGQAVHLERRIGEHNYYLAKGEDKCVALQRAVSKYGMENFYIDILEFCSASELNDREIYWISKYKSSNKKYGYNLSSGGNSGLLGYKHSDETRQKISKAKKGWKMGDAQKEFIRKLHTGKTVSDETRKKISEANQGNKHPMFGKHHSPETIEKYKEDRGGSGAYQFGKKSQNSSSSYHGVHRLKSKGYIYWVAELKNFGTHVYIGSSKDEKEAARMYDQYIIDNGLPNPLNFNHY